MIFAIADGLDWIVITEAALGALNAYLAWQQRKPRQRKPSKVAAKIRDLGHRLVAVPA